MFLKKGVKMDDIKIVIIGLDALVPNLTEKFMNEGIMPNLERIKKKGIFTRMRPVIPAQTPSNWQTIVTGATPGTHSVVVWGTHRYGNDIDETFKSSAFTSGICEAEYLWEVLSEYNKKSVILNYPGYPPTCKNITFIDFIQGPTHSFIDISEPTVYHNFHDLTTGDFINIQTAKDWKNLFFNNKNLLEFQLKIIPTDVKVEEIYYFGLILPSSKGYDRIALFKEKDYKKKLIELKKGEWSGWIEEKFKIIGSSKNKKGLFRFKLLELSKNGKFLKLYRTDIFPSDGSICSNKELGKEIMSKFGPYVNSAQTCHLFEKNMIDFETFEEIVEMESEWWTNVAKFFLEEKNYTLFVCHWHNLDSIGHSFIWRLDPSSYFYNEKQVLKYWDIVKNCYKLADKFVGRFLNKLNNKKTIFVVVSDHGMPANKKAVSLINYFLPYGFLKKTLDGKKIDWKKSKIFIDQNHIWMNLKGREKNGIVDKKEYEELKNKIVELMRDLKDPETGKHVFSFVLPREDSPIIGLWGKYIGDIVFCYNGGYRWSGEEVLKMNENRVIFPCEGGNHGPMIPTYETEITSVMASFLISGPGIRKNLNIPKEEQFKYCTTDIVPTICEILNIRVPSQCEGRVIHEFLEKYKILKPKRKLKHLKRNVRKKEMKLPKESKLKGDVTDEI